MTTPFKWILLISVLWIMTIGAIAVLFTVVIGFAGSFVIWFMTFFFPIMWLLIERITRPVDFRRDR